MALNGWVPTRYLCLPDCRQTRRSQSGIPVDVDTPTSLHTANIGRARPNDEQDVRDRCCGKDVLMNPMTRITPRIDLTMLTAGLAGLLLGVALTFGIVLGTHWFEQVRTVQVLADTTSGIAQSAAAPAVDQAQIDAENMIRHDPVGQSPASTAG